MNTVKIESGGVKMIAHRGLSGLERENTNAAFVAAGNRSYFGIETDVHITADKQFVVIHDETTERVTGGRYNVDVEKSDYYAFCGIVLPDLDGEITRQDLRIPLLIDYIRICKKYEKTCVLELKNHFTDEEIIELVKLIRREEYLDKLIFISFDLNNCKVLRRLLPDQEIQWLVGNRTVTFETVEILCEYRLDLDIYYRLLNKEAVDILHSKGIKVNCWTCDSKEDAESLVKMGVDYITTNILE